MTQFLNRLVAVVVVVLSLLLATTIVSAFVTTTTTQRMIASCTTTSRQQARRRSSSTTTTTAAALSNNNDSTIINSKKKHNVRTTFLSLHSSLNNDQDDDVDVGLVDAAESDSESSVVLAAPVNVDDPWPSTISEIDLYDKFFNHHDTDYQRYHIHLMGLEPTTGGDSSLINCNGIMKRKSKFGDMSSILDKLCDPYCIVQTVSSGDSSDTGSTSYFPVGKYKFPTLKDTTLPIWDVKTKLLGRSSGVTGLKFEIYDENIGDDGTNDELICEVTIPIDDLPKPTSLELGSESWKEYRIQCESSSREEEGRIPKGELDWVFSIKTTAGSDRIVSKEELYEMYKSTDERAYSEEVLKSQAGNSTDNSILQCWRRRSHSASNSPRGAVLWIIGRNDCFMHPHVANSLIFDDLDYDLYV